MVSTFKKPKNLLLVDFLLILTLLLGCFIVEGHSYFDGGRQSDMTNLEMFLSVGGYLLLLVSLFLLLHRQMSIPNTSAALLLFDLAFCVDVVAIWLFPGVYDTGELIYQTDWLTCLRYTAYGFVVFSLLYLLFAIVPAVTAGSKIYDLVLFIAVVIVFSAIIYSYFSEADLYVAMLRNGGPDDDLAIPTSWTTHKNVYSFVLFNGMAAEAMLEAKNPRAWRWGIIIFFYLNQFFVLSKTGLAAATLFIVGFYLWHFYKTVKKHKIRNWVIYGVLFSTVLVLLLIGFLSPRALWLNRFLRNTWDYMIASVSSTLMDRVYVWSDVVRCIASFPLTLIVGAGYGNWSHVFYAYLLGDPNGYYPMDSSWVANLARGGIFGVVFSIVLDLYVLYLLIDAIRHQSKIGVVASLYAVGIFFRSFVEAGDIANPDSFGMIYMALLVLPLLSERYARLHPEIEQERMADGVESKALALPRQPFSSSRFIPHTLGLLCPAFVMLTFLLLAVGISQNNALLMGSDFFYAFLGIALFFPYVILTLIYLLKDRHIYGFITLLFWALVNVVLSFYLPSIGAGWLGALFPFLMSFILAMVVFFSGIVPFDAIVIKFPLIYSLVALALLLGGRRLLESNPLSVYLCLCLMGLSLASCIFIACLPFSFKESWLLAKWNERFIHLGERYSQRSEEAYCRVYCEEQKS